MRASVAVICLVLGSCGAPELAVDPAHGSARGGNEVRIMGTDLAGHGALVVTFDHTAARGVVVESTRLVRVKAPPGEGAQVVDVTLAFADGTTLVVPSAYEYELESEGVVIGPGR